MYLGKRDFVDHLDKVDPVGKYECPEGSIMSPETGGSSWAQEWRRGPDRNCTPVSPSPDGVVLVDPDYLKDRKGTGPEARGLREGSQEGGVGTETGPKETGGEPSRKPGAG